MPVHVQERQQKLNRARQRFEVEHGRTPDLDELVAATGLKPHHVQEALDAVEASVSLNQEIGGDGDGELGDLFADRTSVDPEEQAAETLRYEAVRDALSCLPDRERRVLELRFGFDGEQRTLEDIGRELALTRERVRQLESAALRRARVRAGAARRPSSAASATSPSPPNNEPGDGYRKVSVPLSSVGPLPRRQRRRGQTVPSVPRLRRRAAAPGTPPGA